MLVALVLQQRGQKVATDQIPYLAALPQLVAVVAAVAQATQPQTQQAETAALAVEMHIKEMEPVAQATRQAHHHLKETTGGLE